ncbi:cation diffusion facilitator family transporter [Curtobacterium ammoniigenes]|uniref:cation diffusion facilitator family transporter n=1 Tax=Curtobacterium ammoniigenes TaxID=395387 RepID=UPI0009FAAC94|nr:cation diffusion facilitator family transporter [Curtobacterium ammoniigenes]
MTEHDAAGHAEHGHDHPYDHDHDHPHAHDHGQGYDHEHPHPHPHPHDHGHSHPHGSVKGFLYDLFVPHTHDAADSIDDAMEASAAGIRAVKISMIVLLATTILQFALVLVTGSVALLADTIHNFADALTAVPLWIAFALGRRAATRRYTYGYGRAEDLAGMFIVIVVALSAVVAGWEAVSRFVHPRAIENPWLLVLAGLIGFAGNELVAIYRIRVGRKVGSAALVADGVHARLDGFTSLSVVLGAVGVLLGFPLADPIIGLLIAVSIMLLLWGTVKSIGARLMDAVEPDLVDRATHVLEHVPGVERVQAIRLRWSGHRLTGSAELAVSAHHLDEATRIAATASARARAALRTVDEFTVTPVPAAIPEHHHHDH